MRLILVFLASVSVFLTLPPSTANALGPPEYPCLPDHALAAAAAAGNFTAMSAMTALANRGDPAAQVWFGNRAFSKGNDATAAKWYRKAAEHGDTVGEYNLGNLYEMGRAVPQNPAAAAAWFHMAAVQNYSPAQWELSRLYYSGRGVKNNPELAKNWLFKSASTNYGCGQKYFAGFSGAQLLLADNYYAGHDAKRDYEESYFWYSLSAKGQGAWHEQVPQGEFAVRHLTPEQKSDVDRRVENWLENHRSEWQKTHPAPISK